jgi:hypothetical protein
MFIKIYLLGDLETGFMHLVFTVGSSKRIAPTYSPQKPGLFAWDKKECRVGF